MINLTTMISYVVAMNYITSHNQNFSQMIFFDLE